MPFVQTSEQGFGLVEVMVAAVLLGLGVLLISPMMGWSVKSTRLSKERSGATQAAQKIIEQVQQQGFNQAITFANAVTPMVILPDDINHQKLYLRDSDGATTTAPQAGAKLLQVQRIYHFRANEPQTIADDLIQVTVKITWPGSQGQSVSMGTTLIRDGIQ